MGRKISEDTVDGGPGALVVVGPEVAVGVGLAGAGAPPTGVDGLHRLAVTDEQRGVVLPQLVEADGRDVGLPEGAVTLGPEGGSSPAPRRNGHYSRLVQLHHHDEANAAQRALRSIVASRPGAWMARHTLSRIDLLAHRVAPGRIPPSQWLAAVPVGLLTTTGARSGKPHTVPLLITTLEGGWGVIASNYGSARPPAWYFNLRANPVASLEVDGVAHRVRVAQVQGSEKERVREAALGWYRGYTAYEERAGGRDLGFFVLHPEHD